MVLVTANHPWGRPGVDIDQGKRHVGTLSSDGSFEVGKTIKPCYSEPVDVSFFQPSPRPTVVWRVTCQVANP